LQVSVDEPIVSDGQNCGNILAGVGPFAIERGLVEATGAQTYVSIFMENTGQVAIAKVNTPNGQPNYSGGASIDGVPGTAAAIPIEFRDTAGSTCGSLLPTGNAADDIENHRVTMIDNGMPVVMVSPAKQGGVISTRTFIPHRCHASIGVLGAVSVATACLLKGSVAAEMASIPEGQSKTLSVEHPSGEMSVIAQTDASLQNSS